MQTEVSGIIIAHQIGGERSSGTDCEKSRRDVIAILHGTRRLAAVPDPSLVHQSIHPSQLSYVTKKEREIQRCVLLHDPYSHRHKRHSRCQRIDPCLLFAKIAEKETLNISAT